MKPITLASILVAGSRMRRHGAPLNGPVKRTPARSDRPQASWLTIRNDASSARAEIIIYGQIGRDYWDDSGIADTEFVDALKAIPADREIEVRINSPGGSVKDGLAIYNRLAARRDKVTCIVDGYAISAASWIALAGKRTVVHSNSAMMIHNPAAFVLGDAETMRKEADVLDQHKQAIISMYRAKTGKPDAEISDAMDDETWFIGSEALDWGLADEVITAGAHAQNHATFDLSGFRRVPEALRKRTPNPAHNHRSGATPQNNPTHIMNREELIALLEEHGIQVANDATDAWLKDQLKAVTNKAKAAIAPPPTPAPAAPATPAADPAIAQIRNDLEAMRRERDAERKARITATVNELAPNRIAAARVQNWIDRAIKDETVLDDLRALPQILPGSEPVNAVLDSTTCSIEDIQNGILNTWGRRVENPDVAMQRGRERANIIHQHLGRIMPVLNANTVSADLKRVVILQQSIRAFAAAILPLTVFSTSLGQPVLEGTDEVVVPYFPLDSTASTDFVANDGYDQFGNTNSDAKKLTINKRKYQALKWTSAELRRLPYMDVAKGAMLKAEKLAQDVVADVLSLITDANFGAAAKTEPASAFDSDDIIDLKGVADRADWPAMGRALILDTDYDVNVLKDTSVKSALAFGDNSPIREGRVVRIAGFDYIPNAHIPGNSENLTGFISFPSAILFAQAPIEPTPEVRNQLTRYEVVVEPTSGASFEYRLWGNPDLDQSREVIEVNYGRLRGEAAALKRITSA